MQIKRHRNAKLFKNIRQALFADGVSRVIERKALKDERVTTRELTLIQIQFYIKFSIYLQ